MKSFSEWMNQNNLANPQQTTSMKALQNAELMKRLQQSRERLNAAMQGRREEPTSRRQPAWVHMKKK